MGKVKGQFDNVQIVNYDTCKKQHFKVLLFADNPDHMRLLHRIKRSDRWGNAYIGCWHTDTDEQGKEIIKGQGKKHCHLLLVKSGSPVYWRAVVKELNADRRFLRPVGVHPSKDIVKKESLKKGYQYLVHANCPEKGLISPAQLFGAEHLIENAMSAISEALAKDVSMAAAVEAVCQWIDSQAGEVSSRKLVQFLSSSPYFKAQQSRLIYYVQEEHNASVRRQRAKEKAAREKQERWEAKTGLENLCPVQRPYIDWHGMQLDPDEFEEIV